MSRRRTWGGLPSVATMMVLLAQGGPFTSCFHHHVTPWVSVSGLKLCKGKLEGWRRSELKTAILSLRSCQAEKPLSKLEYKNDMCEQYHNWVFSMFPTAKLWLSRLVLPVMLHILHEIASWKNNILGLATSRGSMKTKLCLKVEYPSTTYSPSMSFWLQL